MTEPRYPLTVALPRGRVRHNARHGAGGCVHTLCGKRDKPVGDGANLPWCSACSARPNPLDQRSLPPTATTTPARISLDNLNDDLLDALYDERERLRAFVDLVDEELDAWTDAASPELLRAALDALRPPNT
ncbi:hypothetical protein [Streptomyces mobaraensis]|uniref:Uncharacterized protein n=1 Tax=Streptomyces mobaraensis TaxID=35621 RepID=A0A5N5WCW5_STRMB|nr:hypothetical protein [Streptomyces mobaraensis]KAB7850171.1 hypothetical protein FRZ00_06120 [Streptomyces mobaraensis]